MSDHLPECPTLDASPFVDEGWDEGPCICDRLRACEQRVRSRVANDAEIVYAEVERATYAAGLSAARDAVAALPHEDGCCSKGCACQTWEKPEPCDLSCNCSFWWMGHALDAIDALRGER